LKAYSEAELVRVKARIWFKEIDRKVDALVLAHQRGENIGDRLKALRVLAQRGLHEVPPFQGLDSVNRVQSSGEVVMLREVSGDGVSLGCQDDPDNVLHSTERDVG
jgi:hypothetical protein